MYGTCRSEGRLEMKKILIGFILGFVAGGWSVPKIVWEIQSQMVMIEAWWFKITTYAGITGWVLFGIVIVGLVLRPKRVDDTTILLNSKMEIK